METTKIKLLSIMEILKETSEENPMTANQICAELRRRKIIAERKSVSRDIKILNENGFDIVMCTDKRKGCYLASRQFEDWELKILIDSVSRAGFLTSTTSNQLIKKLLETTGSKNRKVLKAVSPIVSHAKTGNKATQIAIDLLLHAISDGKKVSFQYTYLDKDLNAQPRKDGAFYTVSPYSMIWSNDYYYLICNTDGKEGLSHYRLDRIQSCMINDSKAESLLKVTGQKGRTSIDEFVNNSIHNFGGKHIYLQLRVDENMIDYLADQFGKDIIIKKEKKSGKLLATVSTSQNDGLYYWLFQFGENLEIVSPKSVKTEYVNRLKSIIKKY